MSLEINSRDFLQKWSLCDPRAEGWISTENFAFMIYQTYKSLGMLDKSLEVHSMKHKRFIEFKKKMLDKNNKVLKVSSDGLVISTMPELIRTLME